MTVPDKIYIPNELLSEEWTRHIEGQDTCYIHKGTLLEWVREEQNRYKQMNGDKYFTNHITVLGDVIRKINEL